MWKFTSFDIVLVDEQTAFDSVNICDLPSSFNLSTSFLVTKVKSDALSSSVLTFIETSRLTHKFIKLAVKWLKGYV